MLALAVFTNPIIDLAVVIVIVLLFFGPKRLPELGKGLGQGMREFKDSISGDSKDEDAERQALSSAPEAPPAQAPEQSKTASGQPAQQQPSRPDGRESTEVGSEPHS